MLLYLNGAFVGLMILSNILAVKLISFGNWFVLPAAVIVYVFTLIQLQKRLLRFMGIMQQERRSWPD